jgi:hypothetical protein
VAPAGYYQLRSHSPPSLTHHPYHPRLVHAFEVQRLVYQILTANVALNALDNVITHNNAVGSPAQDGETLVRLVYNMVLLVYDMCHKTRSAYARPSAPLV